MQKPAVETACWDYLSIIGWVGVWAEAEDDRETRRSTNIGTELGFSQGNSV